MDRFSNFKNYLSNINRSVLLAVGLVVVAGLIAATFIYGETDNDVAENGSTVTNEETGDDVGTESEETGDEADNEGDPESEAGTDTDNEGQVAGADQEVPAELADTGPAVPALGYIALGGAAYLYRRSRHGVVEQLKK